MYVMWGKVYDKGLKSCVPFTYYDWFLEKHFSLVMVQNT